jgi:hypothetical protein
MLSKKQLSDVCLAETNEVTSCRYLTKKENNDPFAPPAYHCCKLHAATKKLLDEKVDAIISLAKSRGSDPADTQLPLGDNCKGYVYGLNYVEQGYDC